MDLLYKYILKLPNSRTNTFDNPASFLAGLDILNGLEGIRILVETSIK